MTNPMTCKDTTWLVSESRERALSKEELEDLEDYDEEDLQHYVSTVLLW